MPFSPMLSVTKSPGAKPSCARSETANAVAYWVDFDMSSVGENTPITGLGEVRLIVGTAGTELRNWPLVPNDSVADRVAVAVASEVGSV